MKKIMFALAIVSSLAMPLMAGEACCGTTNKVAKKTAVVKEKATDAAQETKAADKAEEAPAAKEAVE
jgi:hypothetical protein